MERAQQEVTIALSLSFERLVELDILKPNNAFWNVIGERRRDEPTASWSVAARLHTCSIGTATHEFVDADDTCLRAG